MSLRKSVQVSPELAASNRRNAQNSTGPRTPAGKEHSHLNALRHGLCGAAENEPAVMSALGEDPAQFEAERQALLESYGPGDRARSGLPAGREERVARAGIGHAPNRKRRSGKHKNERREAGMSMKKKDRTLDDSALSLGERVDRRGAFTSRAGTGEGSLPLLGSAARARLVLGPNLPLTRQTAAGEDAAA